LLPNEAVDAIILAVPLMIKSRAVPNSRFYYLAEKEYGNSFYYSAEYE